MFIRIGKIELKPPLLRGFIEPDGGLTVSCEALEDVVDQSAAKKLLDMKGSTELVEWKDKAGVEHVPRTMWLPNAETWSKKSPDGKNITCYTFALKEV